MPATSDLGAAVSADSGYGWAGRLWVVVAGFWVVVALRSHQVGIPVRDPHGEIFVSRFAISLALLAGLAVIDATVRVGRRGWSFARMSELLRIRWTPARIFLVLSGLLAYHLVYLGYHNLKSWDVLNHPKDGMLLRWDRWLFLGHDPATLLHGILGQHAAAYVLLAFYESFSAVTMVAVVAAVVFTKKARDGYVFLASGLWVWILGVGSYYLIPSLGPFHSAPRLFAGLPHTMVQDTQERYMAQRAHLLAHPQAHDAFAQVSAFASLHVAVTTLVLLMARYYGLRRTTRALAVFLVATMLATIYWGWHFALDDVAGLLIAGISVRVGRLMIYPRGEAADVKACPF